jgi:hypothetical protein
MDIRRHDEELRRTLQEHPRDTGDHPGQALKLRETCGTVEIYNKNLKRTG